MPIQATAINQVSEGNPRMRCLRNAVLLVAFVATLTACNGSDTTDPNATAAQNAAGTTTSAAPPAGPM
jgi:hypothetical protein